MSGPLSISVIEKIFRHGLALFLIVAGGDVFFRYFEPAEPPPVAQEFLISLTAAEYIWPAVGCVFLVSAGLLFFKKLVGLALVLLFPVIANIVLYSLFLVRLEGNCFPALGLSLLYLIVAIFNRRSFRSLIDQP